MASHPDTNYNYQLIKLYEVLDMTALSRSSLYALIAKGQFPAPVKIGPRASAWNHSEIADWIDARIAERDQARSAA
jgi:prophage regulatory protein